MFFIIIIREINIPLGLSTELAIRLLDAGVTSSTMSNSMRDTANFNFDDG